MKQFDSAPALVERFHKVFEIFCKAEKWRWKLPGNAAETWAVEDGEKLREWADSNRSKLCSLNQTELEELDLFVDTFHGRDGPRSSGKAIITQLKVVMDKLLSLPNVRYVRSLYELVQEQSDLELGGWIVLTTQAIGPVSFFGRLNPWRFFKRWRIRGLLEIMAPEVSDELMKHFLETAQLELTLRRLRSNVDYIFRFIGLPPQDFKHATTEDLIKPAGRFLDALMRVSELADAIGVAPEQKRLFDALRQKRVGAFAIHFSEIDKALVRYDARKNSLSAIDTLEPWFKEGWLAVCRRRVMSNKPTDDIIDPIIEKLPTLPPIRCLGLSHESIRRMFGQCLRRFAYLTNI
ncbi:MAG: hypothetical protein HQM08_00230 [Candidatus Riflebacteria bacterium]|nr:hypothetical protein [Candidatus Riflebacteria bacterium]